MGIRDEEEALVELLVGFLVGAFGSSRLLISELFAKLVDARLVDGIQPSVKREIDFSRKASRIRNRKTILFSPALAT